MYGKATSYKPAHYRIKVLPTHLFRRSALWRFKYFLIVNFTSPAEMINDTDEILTLAVSVEKT